MECFETDGIQMDPEDLGEIGAEKPSTGETSKSTVIQNSEFMNYSARYWPWHFQQAQLSEEPSNQLVSDISPDYLPSYFSIFKGGRRITWLTNFLFLRHEGLFW